MWKFLSRGRGETEGYSNGGLAEFKGNPLQALAREVCQNSLDAADGSGKPVIVEFKSYRMPIYEFSGMKDMYKVIHACSDFWKGKGDVNTMTFLKRANECLNNATGKFTVLRVSDYNTTGVKGAFSDEDITPWGSLVKGNAFSVKADEKNAAGSYGIGKAAPFVSSYFQTVFYRTFDQEGTRAALGVARLMAHDSISYVPQGEDSVRRSVGYFGADDLGFPSISIKELDELNDREECGTDLFIPGFTGDTSDEKWVKEILKEVVENFLYSIFTGKLEVRIEKRVLSQNNLGPMIDFIGSKDAKIFYEVIRNNPEVKELSRSFHNLGTLRLRLLYAQDLNKKILVVRNSGMKITRISQLPRMISYSGFLELQGSDLNEFFRAMENPRHDAWEPKRHENPQRAKEYKEELETWVIESITKILVEISGEESVIDVGDCFSYEDSDTLNLNKRKVEKILDESEEVKTETYLPQRPSGGKISIRDEERTKDTKKIKGNESPDGTMTGHRHRTGTNPGGNATGRKVEPDSNGPDSVNMGAGGGKGRVVPVKARIIKQESGMNKLIYIADDEITLGRIEILTKGENGKSLKLFVNKVIGDNAKAEDGNIVISNVIPGTKQSLLFELTDNHNYALGVSAYGDKK